MSELTETGWLIERRDNNQTRWLVPDVINDEWTTNSCKAIRFARRGDAEMYCAAHGLDDPGFTVFITDHMWMDVRPKPPSPEDMERLYADEKSIEEIISEVGTKLRAEVKEILAPPAAQTLKERKDV